MSELEKKRRQNERDRKRREREELNYPDFFPLLQKDQESYWPNPSSDSLPTVPTAEPAPTVDWGGGDTGGGGASDSF